VARNRKRAKERRARRPQPVATARTEREEKHGPLAGAPRDDERGPRAGTPSDERGPRAGDARPLSDSPREDERETREHIEDDAAPGPMTHAAPDVELAEAQLAIGRPELGDESEPYDEDFDLEAAAAGGGRGGSTDEADFDGQGPPPDGGGELVGPGGPVPGRRSGTGNRLINFLQGSWRELQRVQWPDRRQVMQATGVVIGFVIVAGLFLGVADFLAGKLVTYILK
jgi:preprotein translocase subunit SecE